MPTRAGARPGGGHPSGYQFAWVERVERVLGTCHQDVSTSPRATTLTVKYREGARWTSVAFLVRAGQPAHQRSFALTQRSFPPLIHGGHEQALRLVATWRPDHPARLSQPNTDQQGPDWQQPTCSGRVRKDMNRPDATRLRRDPEL